MNTHLKFEFTVNKENNTVHVKRQFAAPLNLVWDAWTKPELLDQWWAPKPYTTHTKFMDFTEGGYWLYAMRGPENDTHWCKNDYIRISPKISYTGLDAFCDENGNTNMEMPRTEWTNNFSSTEQGTLVSISAQYSSLEDLEKVISMGFQEGFTMALSNLDELLSELNK